MKEEMMYKIADYGRMFLYLWRDKRDLVPQCKVGDHFVDPGKDPESSVKGRIRNSLFVNKPHYDNGNIEVVDIWDVSSIASKVNKNHKKGRIDLYITKQLGISNIDKSDMYRIDAEEMKKLINEFLIEQEQPLKELRLSTLQYEIVGKISDLLREDSSRPVLAYLCPRFGKTLSISSLMKELDVDHAMIASYTSTVKTSFETIAEYEQFKEYSYVDTQDPDYQNKLKNSSKTFSYVSMAQGPKETSKRESRINFCSSLPGVKALIIDEADLGSHRENQAKLLLKYRNKFKYVIIMTGTNPSRAIKFWKNVHIISMTYPELLIQKNQGSVDQIKHSLKYFKIDETRDKGYPDVIALQLNTKRSAEAAASILGEEYKFAPSWAKVIEDPMSTKGYLTYLAQALFLGQHNLPELNVSSILKKLNVKERKQKVPLIFFPHNTKLEALEEIADILRDALPWEVVLLSSISGITNENAEEKVRKAISTGKNVLILSAVIGQRSFSIPEVSQIFLAFDRGSEASTIQKISRALTADKNNADKKAIIFSLSADPNRDDKLDSLFIDAAISNQYNSSDKSLEDTFKMILETIDFYCVDKDGLSKFDECSYIIKALGRDYMSQIVGAAHDISKFKFEKISEWVKGLSKSSGKKTEKLEVMPHGKVRDDKLRKGSGGKMSNEEINARNNIIEKIIFLFENAYEIRMMGDSDSFGQALNNIKNNVDSDLFYNYFGIKADTAVDMWTQGAFNSNYFDLHKMKDTNYA